MNRRQRKKQQIANSRVMPPQRHPTHELNQTQGGAFIAQQEIYEGQLPHPIHLKGFEDTLPGAAERIFAMTEREQAMAHEAARANLAFRDRMLTVTERDNRSKQRTALVALALCLATSLGLAIVHAKAASAIVGGTTVVAIVTSFLGKALRERHKASKRSTSKESDQ